MTPEEYNKKLIVLVLSQYGTQAIVSKFEDDGLFTTSIEYKVGFNQFILLYPNIYSKEDYGIVASHIMAQFSGYVQGEIFI